MIWRLIKALLLLAVLGAIALLCFSYLGPILMPDAFAPPVNQINQPVILDLQK